MRTLVHLVGPNASVVVDVATGVPTIIYWGSPLAEATDLDALAAATARPIPIGTLDVEPPISLVPLHGDGFAGRPGLVGRGSGGRAWAPRFAGGRHRVFPTGSVAGDGAVADDGVIADGAIADGVIADDLVAGESFSSRVEVVADDATAGLQLRTVLGFAPGGALLVRAELTNTGTTRYLLDGLTITLPVPAHAAELIDYTGRWTRELHGQRSPWTHGARITENRAGRTSHEHPPLVWAVSPGAGEWHGEVWGAHLAWSGNHVLVAECLPDGRRYLQLGELLHPGEICLEPGERYETPWVIATYASDGLTPASWAFHRHVRSRPHHPGVDRPRPVLLNTWEAVYFDHDTGRLQQLADAAAALGIERFVLDDGWFGSRRDDRRGLGDWWVSPEVYPDGLAPLIEHVRGLGMEFGIWVEPEMVNPDSDLYRAHPDWALDTPGYEPVLGRHQLVLDLARPEAFAHVFGQLDALLADHEIAYREVGHEPQSRPGQRRRRRRRNAGPDDGALPIARRAPGTASDGGDRELFVGRRPHRPRHPCPHGTGVGERLQRRVGTPVDPARRLDVHPARGDGGAHRTDAFAHHGTASLDRISRRHGDVRSPRCGVERARSRRR